CLLELTREGLVTAGFVGVHLCDLSPIGSTNLVGAGRRRDAQKLVVILRLGHGSPSKSKKRGPAGDAGPTGPLALACSDCQVVGDAPADSWSCSSASSSSSSRQASRRTAASSSSSRTRAPSSSRGRRSLFPARSTCSQASR